MKNKKVPRVRQRSLLVIDDEINAMITALVEHYKQVDPPPRLTRSGVVCHAVRQLYAQDIASFEEH